MSLKIICIRVTLRTRERKIVRESEIATREREREQSKKLSILIVLVFVCIPNWL